MSEKLNVEIDFSDGIFRELKKLYEDVERLTGKFDALEETVGDGFEKMEKSGKSATATMNVLVSDVLGRSADVLGAPFRAGADAVYDYDTALTELSAITDITGDDLDALGSLARDMALEFGGTAAGHLDSYTKLLSKLDPEIAKNEDAMNLFGRTTAMLANTMGGDADGAIRAITGSMNQYNVSLDDAEAASLKGAEMANIMAGAAKVGAVEVPELSDAITRSGASAYSAGLEYIELASALEVAGKFFDSPERLGTSMRNVFTTLSSGALPKDTLEQLAQYGVDLDIVTDKNLSLRDRLVEFQKIEANDGLMEKVFGAGETIAARGMLQNLHLLDLYQYKISQTPEALEAMNDTIMSSYKNQKALLDSVFAEMRLSVFENLGGALPYVDVIGSGLGGLIEMAPGIVALGYAIQTLATSEKIAAVATDIWAIAQRALNIAFIQNPIGGIIVGVTALVGAVWYAWETFEEFKGAIYGIWEAAKVVFGNIADFFMRMIQPFVDVIDFISNGQWGDAAIALAKGLANMATVPLQFAAEVVTGGITEGAVDAFGDGYQEGVDKFRSDKFREENPNFRSPLFTDSSFPFMPEVSPDQMVGAGGGAGAGGGKSTAAKANQIGGVASDAGKNVSLTIQKIEFNITAATLDESIEQFKTKLSRALTGTLNDVQMTV